MKRLSVIIIFMELALTEWAQGFRNPVLPDFTGVHLGIFVHTLSSVSSYADFDWTEFIFQ